MDYKAIKERFERHGFKTSFFATKEEAASYLKGEIHGTTVGIGGCMTAREMGLDQILSGENQVFWHWNAPGRETLLKARDAKVYILSANGVSETGELVNIDGTGNRLSASLYGPEKVYYLVGRNKLTPDLSSAMSRARNVAATKNAMRFQKKTPCVAGGGKKCYDCVCPERICNAVLILERPCNGMETEVVFIDENLGF